MKTEGGGTEQEREMKLEPSRPWLFLALAFAVAIPVIGYAAKNWKDSDKAIPLQAGCLLVALLCTVFLGRHLLSFRERGLPRSAVLISLGLVLLACGLRYASLQFLPFPTQTGFEESQMGGDGYQILQTGHVDIEFRYSKLLSALGLMRGGDALGSLRVPFKVAGCLGLLFLMLCLRAMEVDWLPTALVTLTAATLRWLVIAGGVADESFSGTPLCFALLWLLIQSDRSRTHSAFWAAGTGIVAGILFFEYTSFRAYVLLAGGWMVWKALPRRGRGMARRSWLPLVCFLLTFSVVAAPALVELFHSRTSSALLDGFRRHIGGRGTLFHSVIFENIKGYFFVLVGLRCTVLDCLAIAPKGQPLVPSPIGFLFALSALVGLIRPRLAIIRVMVLTVVALFVGAGAVASNLNPQRMTAALPLMLVVIGAFLGDAHRWLGRLLHRRMEGETLRLGSWVVLFLYLGVALLAVMSNLQSTRFMASDQGVRGLWVNQEADYPMLRYIDLTARPGQRVLVHTPRLRGFNFSREGEVYWAYARRHPRIAGADTFPSRHEVAPGTLVVVAYRDDPISQDDVRALLGLATPFGSASSLRFYENLAGRKSAASVCIQCR